MGKRTILLAVVVVLSLVDAVVPIPILGIILIIMLVERPRWFLNAVRSIVENPQP